MHRDRVDELMDDPALDPAEHRRALAGLARLNFWSVAANPIVAEIAERLPERRGKSLDIWDVASGSGDVTLGVFKILSRKNFCVSACGFDISQFATQQALRRWHAIPYDAEDNLTFVTRDVLTDGLPGRTDVVMSSLFLHHLERERAVALLREMTRAAERLVVVADLLRTWTGLLTAQVATRLLTTSPVVHTDGPRSVWAAFTAAEFRELAAEAGIPPGRMALRRVWPQRFVASWPTDVGAG